MAEYDIRKIFSDAVKQIHDFAIDHQEETFYAFAIDAGMLCLSSEEGFQKVIEKYRRVWQKRHERIWSRENLTEEEMEEIKNEFEFHDKKILERNGVSTLDEYVNQYIEIENSVNQKRLNKGNPYKKEEKVLELRYQTGDWPYQGFGKLKFDDLEDMYEEHYDMTEVEQHNSDYNQLIQNLLRIFDRNIDKVFEPLKRTEDFKVLNAKHEY